MEDKIKGNKRLTPKNDDEISFSEIFSLLWRGKIAIFVCTILITILGFVFLDVFYSKSKQYYVSKVTYLFDWKEENNYPDGAPFRYNDILTLDNLEMIKNSDEKFESVDVEKMYANNDVTLTKESNGTTTNNSETNTYIFSLKKSYFKNDAQARGFIDQLTKIPYTIALEKIDNLSFDSNIGASNNASVYSTQLNYLVEQYSLLVNGYKEMIDSNGDLIIDGVESKLNTKSNNKAKISELLAEVTQYFDDNPINILIIELEVEGYVKNANYLSQLKYQLEQTNLKKEDNELKIDKLKTERDLFLTNAKTSGVVSACESYNERIAALTAENVDLDRQIIIIESQIGSSSDSIEKRAFDSKIEEISKTLADFTKKYTLVAKKISTERVRIYFSSNDIIAIEGGLSPLITLAAPLAFGLIGSSVIVYIFEYSKKKKVESKEE